MEREMREEFEDSQPRGLLARSNSGYLDSSTNRDWAIWQLAWRAALNSKSSSIVEYSLTHDLTDEEVNFLKQLFRYSDG